MHNRKNHKVLLLFFFFFFFPGGWLNLGSWPVINRTQSLAGLMPSVSVLACVDVIRRLWDGSPNSYLLWLRPKLPIIAIIGQIELVSCSILFLSSETLVYQFLLFRVRIFRFILPLSSVEIVYHCNPSVGTVL